MAARGTSMGVRLLVVALAAAVVVRGAAGRVAYDDDDLPPPVVTVNCTWVTPASPQAMELINVGETEVKIRTCTSDAGCAGSGTKAHHYVDCPLPVPANLPAELYFDQGVNYMVFEYNKTYTQECWPSKTGLFAKNVTVPMTNPKDCAGP
mmetsp:Transcript_21545/g.50534  ORF Transcript_21545/g.50534 Transcript_21545/m.50534 type:complete len:150 (+) Transcript_21545:18-467(+)